MAKLGLTERNIARMSGTEPKASRSRVAALRRDLPNKETRRVTVAAVNEVKLDKAGGPCRRFAARLAPRR
jgi:hypothetical protein